MSDYPSLDQLRGTKFEPFDNTVVQTSDGGERVVLEAWNDDAAKLGKIGSFEVLHEVDSTDRTTLEIHYDDNRRNSFNFVDLSRPEITWVCLWGPSMPRFDRINPTADNFIARSMLWAQSNDE